VDYERELFTLSATLRHRLRAIAELAGMTELEALRTIVEFSKDLPGLDSEPTDA
jgi:hypothetical protein